MENTNFASAKKVNRRLLLLALTFMTLLTAVGCASKQTDSSSELDRIHDRRISQFVDRADHGLINK